jgi:hypothetical protein
MGTGDGGTTMHTGKCPLCTKDGKELQDSHFIGKAVYRRLKDPAFPNIQPVLLGTGTVRQSSDQIRGFVFCYDCEQIFNKQGEAWVHNRIASPTGFPLFESRQAHSPIVAESDYSLYDVSRLPKSEWDCDKLLHYGAAIFFKAGAHEWTYEKGVLSIGLGPHLEELRLFVHGDAGFPKEMGLSLSIAGTKNPFPGSFTPVQVASDGFDTFQFYVAGLMYTLKVGAGIPAHTHELEFSSPKHKLVFVRDVSDQALGILKCLEPDDEQGKLVMKKIAESKAMRKSP